MVISDIVPGSHRYRRRADAVVMDVREAAANIGKKTPRMNGKPLLYSGVAICKLWGLRWPCRRNRLRGRWRIRTDPTVQRCRSPAIVITMYLSISTEQNYLSIIIGYEYYGRFPTCCRMSPHSLPLSVSRLVRIQKQHAHPRVGGGGGPPLSSSHLADSGELPNMHREEIRSYWVERG